MALPSQAGSGHNFDATDTFHVFKLGLPLNCGDVRGPSETGFHVDFACQETRIRDRPSDGWGEFVVVARA
jgi:hypothetical protein